MKLRLKQMIEELDSAWNVYWRCIYKSEDGKTEKEVEYIQGTDIPEEIEV